MGSSYSITICLPTRHSLDPVSHPSPRSVRYYLANSRTFWRQWLKPVLFFQVLNRSGSVAWSNCGCSELHVLPLIFLTSFLVQRIPPVFLTFTVLIILWHSIKRADPLYEIPGPFLARWTPLWLAYQVRRGRKYLVVDALHKVHHPFPSQ